MISEELVLKKKTKARLHCMIIIKGVNLWNSCRTLIKFKQIFKNNKPIQDGWTGIICFGPGLVGCLYDLRHFCWLLSSLWQESVFSCFAWNAFGFWMIGSSLKKKTTKTGVGGWDQESLCTSPHPIFEHWIVIIWSER